MGEWSDMVSPIVIKLEVGAKFQAPVTWNPEGCAALATLIKQMAEKLDEAIEAQLVQALPENQKP